MCLSALGFGQQQVAKPCLLGPGGPDALALLGLHLQLEGTEYLLQGRDRSYA